MIICLRLLPVLMPLSTLIVSRYLIFGNNYELASTLESNLRDTADWGTKWLIDLWLYWFKRSNSSGAIDVKMNRSFLEEKSFKMLGVFFSSKLDWDSDIISIANTAFKKIGALICSVKFLFPEDTLHLCKPTVRASKEYCCHGWAGAVNCHVDMLDKLQKLVCETVCPSLAATLEPLAHRQIVASISLFNRNFFGRCSSELAKLFLLPCYLIFLSPFLDVTRMPVSTGSFLVLLDSEILSA